MPAVPTGTVTFLFTDIEGSTRLLQHVGDAEAARVLSDHRQLLRDAIAAGGGLELQDQGDGFLIVFEGARDAVLAAVAAQRAIASYPWPQGQGLRIRMGLHSGDPFHTGEGYVGLDVHRAARICQAAWGGQILVSQRTSDLLGDGLGTGMALRDMGLHRLKDLQRPEKIFQVIHPDLPVDFPPIRSLDPRATNLPIQVSGFVGREAEMAQIKDLLSRVRLVTLTGAGGSGKTRLALQVAADLTEAFQDGVWLVELAGIADRGTVARAVAAILSVRELPDEPLATTLANALAAKQTLLILDSCEHLIAPCAELTDALLRGCRHLRLLATSREALGVAGEQVLQVPSLSLPDPRRLPSLEALAGFEAIQLFVDRARNARPAFRVTDHNAPAIAEVCQRLDGIPLAIELAAARVRVLSVDEIASRLNERFRLLTGGSRTAPARHQTLQAAMDWSHALLSGKEQALLRRLSVFAGGFALEAAERVCSAEGLDTDEVLDLLTHLVEKSLVVADTEEGTAHYRLLETVRQYGTDRLRDAGEEAALRKQHGDWFLALAERAEPELRGHQQSVWLDRLEREHDNLSAALNHALGTDEFDHAFRLAGALLWFWDTRGYFSEGRERLRRALAGPRPRSDALRAFALIAAGHLAWHQSDYREARVLIEEGLELYTSLNDPAGIAHSLWFYALVFSDEGNYAKAAEIFERSLALYRDLGDRRGIMEVLLWLGYTLIAKGDTARAEELHTTALNLARELGVVRGIAIALRGLGQAASARGDLARARVLYENSLKHFRQIGAKAFYPGLLRRLGDIARTEGDDEQAERLLQESLEYCRDMGEKAGMASCLEGLASLARRRARHDRAVRLFGAAAALRGLVGESETFWKRGDFDADLWHAREAMGEGAFAAAWSEGAAMTLEDIIDYALRAEASHRVGERAS